MRITDYLVQEFDENEYDKTILHKPVFPVNMRLFKTSPFFRQLIMDIINYMDSHLNMTSFEDSTGAPMGISGAKLGVPWNIIGYKNKGKNKFCINPKITRYSADKIETDTNCGALRLKANIKVLRANLIDIEYFDLRGQRTIEKNIGRYEGGFIIQHEVEHNFGICINDKEIAKEKK
jgi:peptide deformylase